MSGNFLEMGYCYSICVDLLLMFRWFITILIWISIMNGWNCSDVLRPSWHSHILACACACADRMSALEIYFTSNFLSHILTLYFSLSLSLRSVLACHSECECEYPVKHEAYKHVMLFVLNCALYPLWFLSTCMQYVVTCNPTTPLLPLSLFSLPSFILAPDSVPAVFQRILCSFCSHSVHLNAGHPFVYRIIEQSSCQLM